jgi:hypothetical protein
MSDNLRKGISELRGVFKIKNPCERKIVLKHNLARKVLYKCLREISKNIVNKKIPLSYSQKQKINRNSRIIKRLARGTKNKQTRKKLTQQVGGAILPWLIPIITTLLNL